MSCSSNIIGPPTDPAGQFGWTDITYLLHSNGISWKYYIEAGAEPDCDEGEMECAPGIQGSTIAGYWNPLPKFTTVQEDNELGNIVPFDQFFSDASNELCPRCPGSSPTMETASTPPTPFWTGSPMSLVLSMPSCRVPTGRTLSFSSLGMIGAALTPCRPARCRCQWLWNSCPGYSDWSLCQARICRSSDFESRRLFKIHRGRFSKWAQA